MENSIYAGLSRQSALQEQMDVIANNIANLNTPGYRAQNMVFTQYLADPRKIDPSKKGDPLAMILDYGQFQSTNPGPLQQTGSPLDVALQGPGYMGVSTPGGVMYTRAGNFRLNNAGDLVTGGGLKVAGAGGSAITIPKDAKEIHIAQDGSVVTDQGQLGKIMLVEFNNIQDLEAQGNGLYKTGPRTQTLPAQNTTMVQGMLEGSNVQPVLEMTRMIDVSRAYQQTQNMLQGEHDRIKAMIERLLKLG